MNMPRPDRDSAPVVLAAWDICSQNWRVAPIQSHSSPLLPSRKDAQVRKGKNRQANGIVNLFVEKKIIDELKRGKGVESRGICNRSNHFEK